MSTIPKISARQVISYYWNHVKHYPYTTLGLFILLPITVFFGSFLPSIIMANVLSRLSSGDFIKNQPWESFGSDIVLYSGSILLTGFVLWRVVDILGWRLEGHIQRNIAKQVFNHLANESADFHANHFSGTLVSQTNKIISSYVRIADTTLYTTLPLVSSLFFAAIIMLPKAPLFVLLLVIFAVIYITVAIIASRRVRDTGAEHARAESKQTGYLADVIGNVMAVKSFAGEDYENNEFDKNIRFTHSKLKLVMRAHMNQMFYFSAISRAIMTMALVLAVVSIVNFEANIATVFLILIFTNNIVDQLFQFSNGALRNYNRSVGDAREMVQILGQETNIKDPVSPEDVKMNRGAIRLTDVVFAHKDAAHPIFNGLNLRIKPGEKVGLVGHSGSGKTSLTRILLRFSDIRSGKIEIDGQNIVNVKQADLRKSISYVPQEPILFHRTILENLSYGKSIAGKDEILAVARKANAHEFIELLPNGYETLVGERGVKLSGGQRQRIAIARAMLKNAPILVLDEATSALDSESEALIQDALWKLMEGRTALVIAHRLSTIQRMDRIIVLDNGRIAEEGSHKELIRQNGIYAKLWNRQSGGFLDE